MALFHSTTKIIGRSSGRSAVAAAAYRSGENLTNERDGIIHDYSRKSGIEYSEIMLPENAPGEYLDRGTLWNAVEKIEKSKNAQLSREIELGLPTELDRQSQIDLLRDYIQENFVKEGMCADFSLHDKGDGNPHAHIMLTMRPINEDKTWGAKSRKEYDLDKNGNRIKLKSGEWKSHKVNTTDWDNSENVSNWREQWAVDCNRVFESKGIEERIDHRSYAEQGIKKEPTIHLGTEVTQMERRGIKTELGDYNREIKARNRSYQQDVEEIRREIKAVQEQQSRGAAAPISATESAPTNKMSMKERLAAAKVEADRANAERKEVRREITEIQKPQSRGAAAPIGATAQAPPKKMSIQERMAAAKIEADRMNAERKTINIPKKRTGPER